MADQADESLEKGLEAIGQTDSCIMTELYLDWTWGRPELRFR